MSSAISITSVQSLDCRVEAHDWVFAREHAARLDAHWEKLRADRSSLYNGRVLLMHDWRITDEGHGAVLHSRHFETGFKSFIGWRDFGFPDSTMRNCFSMAALRSADGAFLLGVMGGHTSNAGLIYFPAGTPDLCDITSDAKLDLEGSAVRELLEETGLDAAQMDIAPDWSVVDAGPRLGCMKLIQAREDAAALCTRADRFIAAQKQPELSAMHVVRTRADLVPALMPDFMLAWLEANLP